MSYAIIMIYINITSFVPISELEKDHSMIETRPLKNVVIFLQSTFNRYFIQIPFFFMIASPPETCTFL